jgi:predicted metal-dependent hydrolase
MIVKNEEICMISFVVVLIYVMYRIRKNKLTIVEASDNGMKLMVYNDKNKRKSADILAEIIKRMFILRHTLIKEKDNYPEYKQYIELLEENLTEDRTKIYENDPNSDLTSFSVNKGEELAFCLKSKRTGEMHEINLLIYVALHEMAHIACPEIGHGDLFKKIFKFLTLKAMEIGVYQKMDYNQSPVEYCGMVLSSSIV